MRFRQPLDFRIKIINMFYYEDNQQEKMGSHKMQNIWNNIIFHQIRQRIRRKISRLPCLILKNSSERVLDINNY